MPIISQKWTRAEKEDGEKGEIQEKESEKEVRNLCSYYEVFPSWASFCLISYISLYLSFIMLDYSEFFYYVNNWNYLLTLKSW